MGDVSGRFFVCAEADILSHWNCWLCLLGRSCFEMFWLETWDLFFSPNLFHLCAAVLHFCLSLVEIERLPYLTSAQEWDFVLWPVLAEASIWCPCHQFHREAGDCMTFSTELQFPAKPNWCCTGLVDLDWGFKGWEQSDSSFLHFSLLHILSKFISIWLFCISVITQNHNNTYRGKFLFGLPHALKIVIMVCQACCSLRCWFVWWPLRRSGLFLLEVT